MPTASINGVSIHYSLAGADAAPPVVLLHGFPLNGEMWRPQVEALSSRWRVTVPDFRGFGRSGETGPFSIEQLADDTRELARQLGLEKFVLVGLSMGGYVAFAYARKYATTLRGLVLLDTKAEGDSEEVRKNRERMIAIVKERGSKPISDAMLGKLVPPEVIEHRPALAKELRTMMEGTRPKTIEYALGAMRDRPDQTSTLSGINVPTLVIVGEKDAITPPDVTGAMATKIPAAQHVIIKGAGHMSNMEQPAQVNEALVRFLEKV